jgi:FkbM family methyltransferase
MANITLSGRSDFRDPHALVFNGTQLMSSITGRKFRMKLRAAIAEIPGARLMYENFCESPGSWLYRRPTLDWLSNPALVRQLPRRYRFFARYCAAQRRDPIGAEMLLRGIIALSARFADDEQIVPLQIGAMTVFLDLQDPRFLRVPTELASLPRVLRRFLQPGDTFIDVGANHGTFSIVASGLVGEEGFIIAVEPQPRLAGLLRRSLAHGSARFEVHQVACGDRSEEVEFYIPLATSGSAGRFGRFSAVSRHRTIKVAMRPLDDEIDWRHLSGRTFIKLDVEGSELAFLFGASKMIRATAPFIMIEVNPGAMRAADSSKMQLVKALIDLGYDRFVTLQELERRQPLTAQIAEADLILLPASFRT